MSTSDAGRKPRTPRSRIRPPLTTSMTVPSTGSPDSAAASILRQAFSKRARFLERIRRPSASSLVRTSASTRLAERDLVGGIDRAADRELVGGDDALGLPADVEQDLVLVDADDGAADDLTLLEVGDRGVVVREDLAVELQEEPVGAIYGGRTFGRQKRSAGCLSRGHGGGMIAEAGGRRSYAPEAPAISARRPAARAPGAVASRRGRIRSMRNPAAPSSASRAASAARAPRRVVIGAVDLDNQPLRRPEEIDFEAEQGHVDERDRQAVVGTEAQEPRFRRRAGPLEWQMGLAGERQQRAGAGPAVRAQAGGFDLIGGEGPDPDSLVEARRQPLPGHPAGDVDEGSGRRRQAQRPARHPLVTMQMPGPVDDDAVPAQAPPVGHRHVDGTGDGIDQSVLLSGIPMADVGRGGRDQGGDPDRRGRRGRHADRVGAWEDRVEPAGRDSLGDRRMAEREGPQADRGRSPPPGGRRLRRSPDPDAAGASPQPLVADLHPQRPSGDHWPARFTDQAWPCRESRGCVTTDLPCRRCPSGRPSAEPSGRRSTAAGT